MTDQNLTNLLLTFVTTYGPLALGLTLLVRSLGLPIPTGLLVLVSGALARAGQIDWPTAAVLALAGTVLGEIGSHSLGRSAGGWVGDRLRQARAATWQQAQVWFKQRGGLAIYATRTLATGLDVPTNLIAGSRHYALRHFVAWDVVGRLCWLLLYDGLG